MGNGLIFAYIALSDNTLFCYDLLLNAKYLTIFYVTTD